MGRFNKILFIYPCFKGHRYDRSVVPPVGIGYVAETLHQNGMDYKVLDVGLGYERADILQWITRYEPDIIGISMMTFGYKKVYELLKFIRSNFRNIPLVVGGPHISAFKNNVLQECDAIDFGICFEGEAPMLELCLGDPIEKIPGLLYRKGETVIVNEARPFRKDLDQVPVPRYSNFELTKYQKVIPVISSRGCPYKCIFCSAGVISGRKFRYRSPQSVLNEISYWFNRGYRKFTFLDDNFTLLKKRVHALCGLMEKANLNDLEIDCAGIRADMVDYSLLKRMKGVGFSSMAIGVESGVERILRDMKKGEELKEIDRAVRDACRLGFQVCLYFVVGNPNETLEDVKVSINFAKKYKIHNVFFSNLIPVPDTELFEIIGQTGEFIRPPDEYLNDLNDFMDEIVFEVPGMTMEEKKTALKLTMEFRKKVQYRVHQNRLSHQRFDKFGLPGRLFAELYSSDFILKTRDLARPLFYPQVGKKT